MVAPAPILHRYRGTALTPNRAGGWLNSLGNDCSGPHHCSRDGVVRARLLSSGPAPYLNRGSSVAREGWPELLLERLGSQGANYRI